MHLILPRALSKGNLKVEPNRDRLACELEVTLHRVKAKAIRCIAPKIRTMLAALLNFGGEGSMKASPTLEQPASTENRLWAKLQIACAVGLVTSCLTGCFRVSNDVGALRDSVMR